MHAVHEMHQVGKVGCWKLNKKTLNRYDLKGTHRSPYHRSEPNNLDYIVSNTHERLKVTRHKATKQISMKLKTLLSSCLALVFPEIRAWENSLGIGDWFGGQSLGAEIGRGIGRKGSKQHWVAVYCCGQLGLEPTGNPWGILENVLQVLRQDGRPELVSPLPTLPVDERVPPGVSAALLSYPACRLNELLGFRESPEEQSREMVSPCGRAWLAFMTVFHLKAGIPRRWSWAITTICYS